MGRMSQRGEKGLIVIFVVVFLILVLRPSDKYINYNIFSHPGEILRISSTKVRDFGLSFFIFL